MGSGCAVGAALAGDDMTALGSEVGGTGIEGGGGGGGGPAAARTAASTLKKRGRKVPTPPSMKYMVRR